MMVGGVEEGKDTSCISREIGFLASLVADS
jgi:hypothetical protein